MREYDKNIYVKDQFWGFHAYKDAPDDVKFLQNNHQHLFKVEFGISVTHDDRELEFFQVLWQYEREIKPFVQIVSDGNLGSCEMIAERILDGLINTYGEKRTYWCDVSEDGHVGAFLRWPV